MTRSSVPPRQPAASPPGPHAVPRTDVVQAFELTDVVSHLLRRAHFRAEALFMQAFQDEDLTPRQKALLITVCKHPGATQNQLAEDIALDRNSLADMINRLVRKGYLQRRRSADDKRAYAVYITEAGVDLLERVLPRDKDVEEAIIAVLPPEYRALFIKCLKLMAGVAP
ncbi:MAG: MarR family winged helix-turn-helix transcriptional regulator [Pigmentiphaga sp.]|uniref:MarR family winged helix-turn-helix transcriptional regulator n=1 Tax=Pigmentiphaga sp. TaxID=1977564 RepID=UPI0029B0B409|nr:MarR family winged helix-turn-helix transcriptional regulator [Pigmentiphaga sp.]MDX3904345.1 MarR family winged helix-turn-helix transcriptional regulator [Pigmentiphaga sp.]